MNAHTRLHTDKIRWKSAALREWLTIVTDYHHPPKYVSLDWWERWENPDFLTTSGALCWLHTGSSATTGSSTIIIFRRARAVVIRPQSTDRPLRHCRKAIPRVTLPQREDRLSLFHLLNRPCFVVANAPIHPRRPRSRPLAGRNQLARHVVHERPGLASLVLYISATDYPYTTHITISIPPAQLRGLTHYLEVMISYCSVAFVHCAFHSFTLSYDTKCTIMYHVVLRRSRLVYIFAVRKQLHHRKITSIVTEVEDITPLHRRFQLSSLPSTHHLLPS